MFLHKIVKPFLLVFLILLLIGCADSLPDEGAVEESAEIMIPIETVLRVISAENDVARALYTSGVVGAGIQAGINFDEDWVDADVEAGPLPALFLRGAASSVAQSDVPLGLFLGSDYPISPANAFSDVQQTRFEQIRENGEPQFFYDDELALHTAMFEDVAVVEACVVCHNEHPESAKDDWVLDDIMGATTWTYPEAEVSATEFYDILLTFRAGVRDSYEGFINEIDTWEAQPEIGERWPSAEQFAVPSTEVFMARFEQLASAETLAALIEATTP